MKKLLLLPLLVLVLVSCATSRPALTFCPRCGWLIDIIDIETKGNVTTTYYQCFSMTCNWVGYTSITNKVTK